MLRFQHVLIRGRWVQDTAFVVECINSGGCFTIRFWNLCSGQETFVQAFQTLKKSPRWACKPSRGEGRVGKNVFPVAYTVLWVRMPVYMCSGLRLKETRRGAALSDFCISFLFKTHTQAKTKHFKYWCGSCDAFGAVGVSRFYVRQLQPIAKRTFSTPIRNIPDHITGKLPPEPQKTLHNR